MADDVTYERTGAAAVLTIDRQERRNAIEQEISEPGGYFQIRDNFTSNEMEVGQLFTMLRSAVSLRDASTRLAPCRAAARAVARPMPLDAPVMTMTC